MRNWLRRVVFPFWLLDAQKKYRWISDHLNLGDSILELGSGMGSVVHELRRHQHQVTAVDVQDTSVRHDLKPLIYDGERLPFADQAFDVCLLLTVLHHCPNPDQVLSEAGRVARRVIVIEDIYSSDLQRKLTHWLDSLLNWEFQGHPHNNRNDTAWRNSFRKSAMQLLFASKHRVALVFCQAIYVLKPIKQGD